MNQLINHLIRWIHKETPLINEANALLVLSIIFLTGVLFTRLAKKLKLPTITGQIFGGIFIGHYILNIFNEKSFEGFAPFTSFALGLIGLTIGSHFDLKKLHNSGKRIISIALTDAIFVPIIVFFGLKLFAKVDLEIALIVSAISTATAPGSVIHIIKETRAKGIFTKTLLAVVALNNIATVVIFYSVIHILLDMKTLGSFHLGMDLLRAGFSLGESFITGLLAGLLVIKLTQHKNKNFSFFTLVLVTIVLVVGISETLHYSSLISTMVFGAIITNYSHYRKEIFNVFRDIENDVFALFFVLAGTHLDFHAIFIAGYAGLVLIIFRGIGKYIAPTIGSVLAGSTSTIKNSINISLFPFAGVAIGLVLYVSSIPEFAKHSQNMTAIILTAVVFYEIVGPLLTKLSIKRAGEINKNRVRLLDFLQEEFILVGIEKKDKWVVLEELAEFLHRTHRMDYLSIDELKRRVVEREKEISTGIGEGIAIPHVIVDEGPMIQGVIGVSKHGIDFESLDGKPVHIIVLIATPKEHYDLHLNVLQTIAKIFGHHPSIKNKIIDADTPEEIFEILQTEEIEELNPFFED